MLGGVGRAARSTVIGAVGRAVVWPIEFAIGIGIAGAVTLLTLGVIVYAATRRRDR